MTLNRNFRMSHIGTGEAVKVHHTITGGTRRYVHVTLEANFNIQPGVIDQYECHLHEVRPEVLKFNIQSRYLKLTTMSTGLLIIVHDNERLQ